MSADYTSPSPWHQFLRLLSKNKLAISILLPFVFVGNYLAAIFFNSVQVVYSSGEISTNVLEVDVYSFAPSGGIAIIVICLLVELRVLGWNASSLKRILEHRTISSRTDIFYAFLTVSSIGKVLAFLFSLGLAYWFERSVLTHVSFDFLRGQNLILSFLILALANSFCFYAYHWLLHTRCLWELHKTHHSASEMTIVNNFRNHPLDGALRTFFFVFPGAILGISPDLMLTYAILAGVIVLMQHSDMNWNLPFVEKYLLIGSNGHRIHHSQNPEHAGKNFGYLVLWDWLFGTLSREDASQVVIGIEDDDYNVQNTGSMYVELVLVFVTSAKVFFRQLFRVSKMT